MAWIIAPVNAKPFPAEGNKCTLVCSNPLPGGVSTAPHDFAAAQLLSIGTTPGEQRPGSVGGTWGHSERSQRGEACRSHKKGKRTTGK